MYVRPPSAGRSGMKLPENYSGSAFSRQPQYSDMPPPARMHGQRSDTLDFDISLKSDIPSNEIPQAPVNTQLYDRSELQERQDHTENHTDNHAENVKSTPTPPSIFASLLPKGTMSSHFPFGHGIGSEELLILAVMLMVFLSGNETGETDSEFILLLGLLLFAG